MQISPPSSTSFSLHFINGGEMLLSSPLVIYQAGWSDLEYAPASLL
jgi:hypothetical protein